MSITPVTANLNVVTLTASTRTITIDASNSTDSGTCQVSITGTLVEGATQTQTFQLMIMILDNTAPYFT